MGLPSTPWDGRVFVVKGESNHNQQMIVEFQNDCFDVTPSARIPYPGLIDTACAADVSAITLGPFATGYADTSIFRTRCTCYVPPVYVPLFIAGPLTSRQAWEVVRAKRWF